MTSLTTDDQTPPARHKHHDVNVTLFFEFTTPNFRQQKDTFYHLCCQAARFATDPSKDLLQKLNERYCTFAEAR